MPNWPGSTSKRPSLRDDVSESVCPSDESLLEHLARTMAQGDRASIETPPVVAPVPRRAGPSFDEHIAELMAAGPPPQPPVQEPPPLVPLWHHPGPGASRPQISVRSSRRIFLHVLVLYLSQNLYPLALLSNHIDVVLHGHRNSVLHPLKLKEKDNILLRSYRQAVLDRKAVVNLVLKRY
ncbi:hypothetical protein SCP_1900850 [Sparassis crispa]|uniref:Uncharacterized protein n=1 Tax=Sparassis crispa TaxID=139825 RepID=A0A401H720_9APHY|nr:hypothetical protein SCP_1900850 [Sparassis crispa]GBE90236.1 hypothetical protein SCP_1900850 [Sparassis crispa]